MATAYPTLPIKQKSYHRQAFFYALIAASLIFIPFIIMSKGVYVHYGDFNVQQIPFYQLAHKAVGSGDIFWSWYTDLGANFIGSYSFYLLFSPFFWLTLPFPNWMVPYLMGPLLILKTACASLTAYLYLERFVKDRYYAVIGGLLYAFSGWMTFNIFFNHFHDVAVFFPLLLLGAEKLVKDDKKLFFALMVALNAMVSYWFFVGEVVFIIIYVIVRSYSGDWGITWKKFIRIGIEAVFGFLLASFAVLPSVMALSGNPRTSASKILYGWGMWIFWHNSSKNGDYAQRVPAILSSIIFPPELAAIPNFFHKHGAEWSSMSAWLPMFSVSGIIAYFSQNKTRPSWIKKLLALCLVFALVPVLNSLFVLLNNSYYARWFYMPVLIMALATIIAVENSDNNINSFKTGVKWTLIPATAIAIAAGLTPDKVDGEWVIGVADQPFKVWIWFAIVVIGLVLVGACIIKYRQHKHFKRMLTLSLAIIIVGFGAVYLTNARLAYPRTDAVIDKALGGRGNITLPEGDFVRSDIYKDDDNLLMYWELPNIQAFHSVVPPSIMEFYPEVGVDRSVASRPDTDSYAIRSLLSVKWLFINTDKDNQEPMPGYTYYDTQRSYNIYENDFCIPMGFTYDYAIDPDTLSGFTAKETANLLVRAVVLEPEDIKKNSDILTILPKSEQQVFDEDTFFEDSVNRMANTASDFTISKRGFTANTDFERSQLVFFSVPFEKGWSAKVNGSTAEIIKANIGFMAVRVPPGQVSIAFSYMTPGLIMGIIISLIVILILVVWYILIRRKRRLEIVEDKVNIEEDLISGKPVTLSWEQYLSRYDTDERKKRLHTALTNAESREIIDLVEGDGLPIEEADNNDKK